MGVSGLRGRVSGWGHHKLSHFGPGQSVKEEGKLKSRSKFSERLFNHHLNELFQQNKFFRR